MRKITNRSKLAIAATVYLFSFGSAEAGGADRTAQTLYLECKGNDAQKLACLQFVSGVASVMVPIGKLVQEDTLTKDVRDAFSLFGICLSEPISNAQVRQVFINWMEKHPEKWQESANFGVMAALQDFWPCRL